MTPLKLLISAIGFTVLAGCSATAGTTAKSQTSIETGKSSSNLAKTRDFYQSMVDGEPDISKLNLFLTQMPKGGDIHHHYSGTIYAETYLEWVKQRDWRINSCTVKIVTSQATEDNGCKTVTIDELYANEPLYRRLLMHWSDKDFDTHFHIQPPPDMNFFGTFFYFGPVSDDDEHLDVGLSIIRDRAIAENISYIETQLGQVDVNSGDYFSGSESADLNRQLRAADTEEKAFAVLDRIANQLISDKAYNGAITDYVKMATENHNGIDTDEFTLRFQTFPVRVLPPLEVFTKLLGSFLVTEASPLFVGVNIVAPEHNIVALRDYTLHMRMFKYLHQKYPNVSRALHAGELTLGQVRPKDLLFHIKEARGIANAQRIGHGIDIPYEQDSLATLADMKENAAVEINLTSNEFILGVEGQEHPYLIYEAYGVPIVITTDDSGVSRNNLTNEYVKLATRYQPTYDKIKEYVYNSIKYSFMSDADKAENISRLDKKFAEFEANMAQLATTMDH